MISDETRLELEGELNLLQKQLAAVDEITMKYRKMADESHNQGVELYDRVVALKVILDIHREGIDAVFKTFGDE